MKTFLLQYDDTYEDCYTVLIVADSLEEFQKGYKEFREKIEIFFKTPYQQSDLLKFIEENNKPFDFRIESTPTFELLPAGSKARGWSVVLEFESNLPKGTHYPQKKQ